jgi:hypothetical protein
MFIAAPLTGAGKEGFDYRILKRTPDGWTYAGEGIGCEPTATTARTRAPMGYWELDPTYPAPGPGSTTIHLKVWGGDTCRQSVRCEGGRESAPTEVTTTASARPRQPFS